MRKTKIVCTIGPVSESPEFIVKLIKAGMNVARLNFSHGSHEEHKERIKTIKRTRERLGKPIAIMLDTKGPEVRLGCFKDGKAEIENGQKFVLTTNEVLGDNNHVTITYKELPQEAQVGTRILIADGLLELRVTEKTDTDVICEVVNGGTLGDRKNVNIPGATSKLPAITEKDISDLKFGIENGIDFIAASFIRKSADVLEIRKILEENNAGHIQIIAKIENQEGVDNLDEILKVADGLMVARGDLGVEIPTEEIPLMQKKIIRKANLAGKPVITATQMLDSMIRNPRPTRAEVTDIANSIFDGTDAIMLSGETASGKFPIESVETMAKVAEKAESALKYGKILTRIYERDDITVANAISHASCTMAYELGAEAIITPTQSGSTARMVSKFRPKAPIIAATPYETVRRKLSLSFGVYSVLISSSGNTDDLIDFSVNEAVTAGLVKSGDLVIITAGVPAGVAGTTNLIKAHTIGEIIAKGTGIGSKSVSGKVCVLRDIERDASKFEDGDILIMHSSDEDIIPIMKRAAAFIVEEGGLTSDAAIAGLALHKPVIVGVENAVDIFENGQVVTLDTERGLIYKGIAKVL